MIERHVPVLAEEIKALVPKTGLIVDGTVGDGGHAELLLQTAPKIKLIGVDRDPESIKRSTEFLKKYDNRCRFLVGSYADLPDILGEEELKKVRFVLLDLGYSSAQLADPERGLAFSFDGPLDMRYDQTDLSLQTAADIVNRKSFSELEDILRTFGEEHQATKIVKALVAARHQSPIKTTGRLKEIIESVIPLNWHQKIHPATKTFQALRIVVNRELEELTKFVTEVVPRLPEGCVVAVISFHSLEDRIVKQGFRLLAKPERDIYGERPAPRARLINKHVLRPSDEEQARNPRARSAKLRVCELYSGSGKNKGGAKRV